MIKRPSIETKINHERWLVSYSDFITLLFAFFVVMYSVSQVNEQKYQQLSETLSETFKTEDRIRPNESQNAQQVSRAADLKKMAAELSDVLADLIKDNKVTVEGNEQWVEIDVNANLIFSSGSADPSQEAEQVFTDVAKVLSDYDNRISVAGHTDNVPIKNAQFQDNWALSAARSVSVVNLLARHGVAQNRLSAVGYGEHQPVADNTSEEGKARNRRVVLRVAQTLAPPQVQSVDTLQTEEKPLSESEISQELENDSSSDGVEEADEQAIQPYKLKDGGLLFTSDPDSPRLQSEENRESK
ncbi:flagellar motor protein MotB [Teredinibacter sp. KSP-S5-2]|uniref:flagellar motor protein MotB n=1 Tax=Teredinibacter sp. KSP-S5-2 TaxID=3034506 RepID=UPI0029343952|nr:flagellar motor protein MotB [Teredinibacter sp. KSP-S5-2]WNO07887.1 flagellar motor protein MotB [Teredinibacter sp. KSP-S5-2]